MRKLLDPRLMPPTGFFYADPDTSNMVQMGTLATCIEAAARHRRANGLEVPDNFAEIVEDFICLNNDPDFSIGDTEKAFKVPLTESWIRQSIQDQLGAWRKSDRTLVSENDSYRRAEICSHREMNVRTPVCFSCVGLDTMVDSFFTRTTPLDRSLRVCKLTAVPLKSLVHVPGEVLIDHKKTMPAPCWYAEEIKTRKS